MTERDIERQLGTPSEKPLQLPQNGPREEDEELSVLRRYLAAGPEIRAKIDALAEERTQRLLKTLSVDKRVGVLEQARLEAAQEVLDGKKRESGNGVKSTEP